MVSFDIKVALYNVRASGYKDFLSVGEDMLPLVFMVHQCPSDMLCFSACCCAATHQKMLDAAHAGIRLKEMGASSVGAIIVRAGSDCPAMHGQ